MTISRSTKGQDASSVESEAQMSFLPETDQLTIADSDNHIAHRLVSALVRSWDQIPITTQVRLLNDAILFPDREGEKGTKPSRLLQFIEFHKSGQT